MKKIEFINKSKIIEKLKDYGIEKLPYLLIKSGKEKIRIFSGHLSKEEITKLRRNVYIETLGLYFAKFDNDQLRLNLDSLHLLKNKIKNKIINLNKTQTKQYFEGKDVEATKEQLKIAKEKSYYILKHNEDILGMSKIINNRIRNYLPKERRIKTPTK